MLYHMQDKVSFPLAKMWYIGKLIYYYVFIVRQTIEINGSSKHLQGTLPRETTSIPSSGNLHRPAGLSGMK